MLCQTGNACRFHRSGALTACNGAALRTLLITGACTSGQRNRHPENQEDSSRYPFAEPISGSGSLVMAHGWTLHGRRLEAIDQALPAPERLYNQWRDLHAVAAGGITGTCLGVLGCRSLAYAGHPKPRSVGATLRGGIGWSSAAHGCATRRRRGKYIGSPNGRISKMFPSRLLSTSGGDCRKSDAMHILDSDWAP